MPKYYAVKNGRSEGVYTSWDDCKAQTNGYSNAQFKSFNTAEEANSYMSGSASGHSKGSSHSSGYNYSGSGYTNSSGGVNRMTIYTDGACAGNGYNGARAGIGVHFPDYPEHDISEALSGRQTNNRAEIRAATRGIQKAKELGQNEVTIKTDSQFLHNSVNQWIPNWKTKGWKTSDGRDVINKDDFLELEAASKGMDIKYEKVAAHKGVPGNEKADRLANQAIGRP